MSTVGQRESGCSSGPILALKGIGRRFGGVVALAGIDLVVERGSITALIGPNGAGKTTLFNIVAGLHAPTSGRVVFDGCDVTDWKPHRRARAGLARTFQITQPFVSMTVEENVLVGALCRLRNLDAARALANDMIAFVGLAGRGAVLAGELSTGQRKRLELARAMATRPRLLLLDEVTGGVDHASLDGLIDLIHRLREAGTTILLIEHNVRLVGSLADRAVFLDRGTILVRGTPAEVGRDHRVVELYLGNAAEDA